MKIINILDNLKQVAIMFTMIYIWIASSHYLFYNVNMGAARACFYGGLSVIALSLITSPRIIKYIKSKEAR